MPPEIRLIATDLDGTLIGGARDFPLYQAFSERINEMRASHNASWAACTGRSFSSFREFFHPMQAVGITPDFVVTRHSFIYQLTRAGYMPHLIWDAHILFLIWMNKWYARDVITQWHELMTAGSLGVMTIRRRRDHLWVRFDSPESAQTAADLLRKKMTVQQHLRVFVSHREVDVRPVPFTKGLAVAELARHLECGPEQTLTIGNGNNDLSMLSRHVAHFTGCPGNSEPEVLMAVHESGGHLAKSRSLAGVMEILEAYMTDTVSSELPLNWQDPPKTFRPNKRTRRHSRPRHLNTVRWSILASCAYVVVLVLASFGVIPFGDTLLKPWRWLMSLLTNLLVSI